MFFCYSYFSPPQVKINLVMEIWNLCLFLGPTAWLRTILIDFSHTNGPLTNFHLHGGQSETGLKYLDKFFFTVSDAVLVAQLLNARHSSWRMVWISSRGESALSMYCNIMCIFFLYISLYIFPSACVPVFLSAFCLSVCLSVCLPAWSSVCLFVCWSAGLPTCLPVCLSSVYLSVCLTVLPVLSVCLAACWPVSVCLTACLSVCLTACLSEVTDLMVISKLLFVCHNR
jgi:hypothetical protein